MNKIECNARHDCSLNMSKMLCGGTRLCGFLE